MQRLAYEKQNIGVAHAHLAEKNVTEVIFYTVSAGMMVTIVPKKKNPFIVALINLKIKCVFFCKQKIVICEFCKN